MSEQNTMVTLTIDGQDVTVPAGTLLIRAAEQLGIVIPRFCDHPLLDPVGACRQCAVEVEGQRKPVMSCTWPVSEGMVVRTHMTDDAAKRAQEGTLELLLINHPLDCPMCDKGGECPLQDQALAHGANISRFVDEKRRYDKPVAVSAQVLLDRERCVLCARCTRFSEQISGDPFIELFERGALEQVAIYEDEPYESYFSGNVIQICPVGALTSTDYRFKARPFDVVSTPSVCEHCSAGCTQTIQSRNGTIQRQLARTNMDVNEAWNCDKGRFTFGYLTADTRITEPAVAVGDTHEDTTWTVALTQVADTIRDARAAGKRTALITGGRLADEDSYVAAKFARVVLGTDDVDARLRFQSHTHNDELLAYAAATNTATYQTINDAKTIVITGLDPEEELPIVYLRIRKAWRNNTAKIVVVGPSTGSLAGITWRHVVTSGGTETAAFAALAADDMVMDAVNEGPTVVLVGERAGEGTLSAAAAFSAKTGASYAYLPRRTGARAALDKGLHAGVLPGGRKLTDATDRAAVEQVWNTTLPTAAGGNVKDILTAAANGEIDVLYLIGVDLVADAASSVLARQALTRTPTVIVQDLARNATTPYATVVLPVTARQERAGTATNWEGRRQSFFKAVAPTGSAQDDHTILSQLAMYLGYDFGCADLGAIQAEIGTLGRRDSAHPYPPVPDGADSQRVVVRPRLLTIGATLAVDVPSLMATARAETVVLDTATAATLAVNAHDTVMVRGNGHELPATVLIDSAQAPDTILLPQRLAGQSIFELADADGVLDVTLAVPVAKTFA
jgi:NADH-quinone oxidoreductase subunit G